MPKVSISILVDAETNAELRAMALEENRSVSGMGYVLFRLGLAAWKGGSRIRTQETVVPGSLDPGAIKRDPGIFAYESDEAYYKDFPEKRPQTQAPPAAAAPQHAYPDIAAQVADGMAQYNPQTPQGEIPIRKPQPRKPLPTNAALPPMPDLPNEVPEFIQRRSASGGQPAQPLPPGFKKD